MLSYVTTFNKKSVASNTTLNVADANSIVFVDTTADDYTITIPVAWPEDGTLYVHNNAGANKVFVTMLGGVATFYNGTASVTSVELAAGVCAMFTYTNYATKRFDYLLNVVINPDSVADNVGFTSMGWRLDTSQLGLSSGSGASATLTNIAVKMPYTWDNPVAGPTVTLVSRTSTDTLANKTLTAPVLDAVRINGNISGTTPTFTSDVVISATGTLTANAAARVDIPFFCSTYRDVTTPAVITVADTFITADTSAADVVATLPAASASTIGKVYFFFNRAGANNINVTKTGADTIDGGAGPYAVATTTGAMIVGVSATGWRHMLAAGPT